MTLDVKKIRQDFPLLKTGIAYLDNAASSLTPEPVLDRMLEFYREYRANVGRGVHRLAQMATQEYSRAREEVKEFIGAGKSSEIVFTKNTTESINLAARGLKWRRGDQVVTTLIEHHSNFLPWKRLSERGVELKIVKPGPDGLVPAEEFEHAITDRTRLVAVCHVSNVLGCVLPVREISRIAHEHGGLVLVDGAQSVPHQPVDINKLECDMLAFSGHKMLGPTGIGVLYAREEVLRELEPLETGGGSIAEVSSHGYTLLPAPEGFEAGTPPIAEAIGLAEAVRYLKRQGMEAITTHEQKLTERLYEGLREIEKVEVYGPERLEIRTGIVPFNVGALDPHEVAAILDNSAKVMVRSGHHCAMPLHREFLKREGSVRASLYLYNTLEEVERLLATVEEIARTLT